MEHVCHVGDSVTQMFLSFSGQPAAQIHHLGPEVDCGHAASSPVASPGPAEPGGAVRVESSPAAFPHCLQWWSGGWQCCHATSTSLLGGCRASPSRTHLPRLCVYGGCSSWLAWVGTSLVHGDSILWDIPRTRQTCHLTQRVLQSLWKYWSRS